MNAKQEAQLPKVLRIGIIQGGKIIEERKLKKRETVSVGQSPKAMFSVSSAAMPQTFDLFELVGNEYYLRFTDDMEGVVQLDETVVHDLNQLKNSQTQKRGNAYAFKITDASRGKVKFGEVTVLFQFRPQTAAAGKIELPPEAKGSFLSNVDTQFASILVVVGISIISLAAYARSVPYIEPTTIEEIGERYQKLIMPDRIPEPPKDEVVEEAVADKGKEKAKEETKDKGDQGKSKSKGEKAKGPVDAEAAARARKEALAKAVAGKGLLGVIGVKGKNAGALSDVFSDGDTFGEGALSDAFSGIQGMDIAGSGGERGTRGGGAGTSAGIGDLETSGGGSVESGSKTEAAVSGNVLTETPEVEGELNADVIKNEMRKRLRALKDCYERQLKRFPTLQGKIVLSFEIAESGRVSDARIEDDSVNNSGVSSCIIERARTWRFPKPDGGSVFVSFPLIFTPAAS